MSADGSGGITLDMLRETFEDWRITETEGVYLAMRSGAITAEGPQSLIVPFVFGSTVDGLADRLSLQEWLRRMTAAELEAVWRDRADGKWPA